MEKLESLIRLLILIVSFYGYLKTICRKIKLEFSIGILFCSIGSIMFFAGILNIMQEAAVTICLTGVFLAFQSVRKKEKLTQLISAGTVFFVISCVYFFFLLYHSIFIHYDNFSHWAIATKKILQADRFPNFTDINISFQSYPLGYASFIYYISKIIGIESEWIQMFAQAILMSGIVTGLFAFAKNRPQKILTAVGSILLLAGNTNFTDLLVDTLLPITALGVISFCMYYRDDLYEKIFWSVPYTVFLVTIKNSGMFFAVVILVYLLVKVRNRENLKLWAINALCPVGTLLLWQKHVKLVFNNGLMSYHSMSPDYFRKMLGQKDAEEISVILSEFVRKMFSLSNEVLFICILLLVLCVVCFRTVKQRKYNLKEIVLLTVFSYLSYQIMLLAMYLFTMPVNEALRLAEYLRYHDTILIFIAGISLIATVEAIGDVGSGIGSVLRGTVALVLCAVSVYCAVTPTLDYYTKQDVTENFRGVYRTQYEQLVEEYDIPTGESYAILIKTDRSSSYAGFLRYLTRYLLDPEKVTTVAVDDLEKDNKLIKGYDYLIVFDTTDDVNTYMTETYGTGYDRVIPLAGTQ